MGMDAPHWTEHPDVLNMVRLAVKRRIRLNPALLSKNRDLDEESIVQDLWGECFGSKYDPSKTKPGSFAYTVAWNRFNDIARARGIRIESDSRPQGESRTDGRNVAFDDPEAEIAEIARRIYVSVAPYCDQSRPVHTGPGRPTPTFAQKTAITMLMKEMGWSMRDAERETARYPDILAAVGVTQSKSRQFFCSASKTVTKFARKQKRFLAVQAASSTPPLSA